MSVDPLTQPCAHLATPEESRRDPSYTVCAATPGLPCTWARRYDGELNPPFHSERLEYAANPTGAPTEIDPETLDTLILNTGLI